MKSRFGDERGHDKYMLTDGEAQTNPDLELEATKTRQAFLH